MICAYCENEEVGHVCRGCFLEMKRSIAVNNKVCDTSMSLMSVSTKLVKELGDRLDTVEAILAMATMFQIGPHYQVSEHDGKWFVINIMADGDPDWDLDHPMTRDEAIKEAKRLGESRC